MRRGTSERERAGRAEIGGGASSRKLQDSASASPTQDKRRRDIASLLETLRDLSALSSHLASSSPVSSVLVWSCLPCAFRFHRSSVGRPSLFLFYLLFLFLPFFLFLSFFLSLFLYLFLSLLLLCLRLSLSLFRPGCIFVRASAKGEKMEIRRECDGERGEQ